MRPFAPLRWLACIFALVATLGFAADATIVHFDIPADTAATAVKAFARQSGCEVIIRSDKDGLVKTNAVQGNLTAAAALDAMLKDTGLVADRHTKTGAFAIRSETETESKNAARAVVETDARPSRKFETDSNGEKILKLDTFEVFGRKTLNMDLRRSRDDAQPYVIFDRPTIERSGAVDVNEFLKQRLTMSSNFTSNAQASGSVIGPSSVVNLRGLGSLQTLILIDGHRAAGIALGFGDTQQPDLNGIPMAAIERIEVLPTTASAIYGGSATGGVVNVILRREYAGAELRLTYGNTFDTDAAMRRVDLMSGFRLEHGKTNVLLSANWSDQNTLSTQDRGLVQRGYATLAALNPAAIYGTSTPIASTTTNIRSSNGANLTLKPALGGTSLGSPITFLPVGYGGFASDGIAALVANAGKYNLDFAPSAQRTGGGRQSFLHAPETKSFSLTVRREFTDYLSAFVEASTSGTRSSFVTNGIGSFTIAANAPNNPFVQALRVTAPAGSADTAVSTNLRSSRVVAGLQVKLPAQWQAEADYTWSESSVAQTSPNFALISAATSGISNGSIDLLRDLNRFPVNFASLLNKPTEISPGRTTLKDATLRASGPVNWPFALAPLSLSGLVEHREETLGAYRQTTYTNGVGSVSYTYPNTQKIDSVYAELRQLLATPQQHIPAVNLLELQVAARHDEYRTSGVGTVFLGATDPIPAAVSGPVRRNESTDPTIGLRWQPVEDVTFRGSYSTGFVPPSPSLLYPTPAESADYFSYLADPLRGNEPIGTINYLYGGNPDLKPENSESWSAGVIFSPKAVPNLRLSVDWTRTHKTNNVASPPFGDQASIDVLTRLGRIKRGAPSGGYSVGPITEIDTRLINVAEGEFESIDFAADYEIATTSAGTFGLSAAATRMLHARNRFLATDSFAEYVDTSLSSQLVGGVKWKGNGTLTWKYRGTTVGWTSTYLYSYFWNTDHSTVAGLPARIGSQLYHDVFVRHAFSTSALPSAASRYLNGLEVIAGVKNVFNREPPFSTAYPYYSRFGDPRLANYYVTLKLSF